MSANTKIFVLRSKELMYTTILIVIGIVILLIVMSIINPGKENTPISEAEQEQSQPTYMPGVYTSTFSLGNSNLQLQVTVDSNHINDISLINLSDAITTMYPLVEPTLNDLSTKILESQSIENITYPEETKYTSILLLNTLERALLKASK